MALLLSLSACFIFASTLSMTVGEVKDHVVTSREVQINHMIEYSLYRNSKEKVKLPQPGTSSMTKATRRVLLEWVVYLESKGFSRSEVSRKEMDQAIKSLRKTLSKNKDWSSLQVGENESKPLIRRKIQSKKFIRFKAESSKSPVSDIEAQRYFTENRKQFGNLPFDNFKERIKIFLERERVDLRLRDWFEVLQAKYGVKNHLVDNK